MLVVHPLIHCYFGSEKYLRLETGNHTMATTAEQSAGPATNPPRKHATDPFGGGIPMALVALAVTAIGFYRSFLSQPASLDAAHLVHGVTSIGWLLLVLVQAWLIRSGQYKTHRFVGWTSLALFAVLLVTSWQMVALMLSGATGLPFGFAKIFAYSDLITLPLMILFYGAAILLRKDRHLHSRLISATMLVAIVPAVARMFNLLWPGKDGLIIAMHPTYLFVLAVLAVAIFTDWKNGRLRWPFPFAFVWFTITYATLFSGSSSHWFDSLARTVGGIA